MSNIVPVSLYLPDLQRRQELIATGATVKLRARLLEERVHVKLQLKLVDVDILQILLYGRRFLQSSLLLGLISVAALRVSLHSITFLFYWVLSASLQCHQVSIIQWFNG